MIHGSIAVPGAVILVNNDLSETIKNRLVVQLQIDEIIDGYTFDSRLLTDSDYVKNIRALRRRVMVVRDFRETNNRDVFDVVIFVKEAMASITQNCFGHPGGTFLVKYLHWGQLCIFDTVLDRSCSSCGVWYSSSYHNGCCPKCGDCDMTYATHFGQNNKECCARFPFKSGGFGRYRENAKECELKKNYTYECNENGCTPIDCPPAQVCCLDSCLKKSDC
jgi:hypothetical protein